MDTVAVPCNDIPECHGGVDEGWLCSDSNYVVYALLGFLGALLVFATLLKWKTQRKITAKNKSEENESKNVKIFKITPEMVEECHKNKKSKRKLNMILWKNMKINTHEERIIQSQHFFTAELHIHNQNKAETVACLKNCLKNNLCKIIFEDNLPGFFRRKAPRLEKKLQKIDSSKMSWMRWLLKKVGHIAAYYVDFFKDFYLGVSILVVIGGVPSLLWFPTKLTSVVVISLFLTVFGPLFVANLDLAIEKIEKSNLEFNIVQKIWIIVKTLALSGVNPILIINKKGEHSKYY